MPPLKIWLKALLLLPLVIFLSAHPKQASTQNSASDPQQGVLLLPQHSEIERYWRGMRVSLALSGPTLWRAHILDNPKRLIIAYQGSAPDTALSVPESRVESLDVKKDASWVELEFELSKRMIIESAAFEHGNPDAINLVLRRASETAFSEALMDQQNRNNVSDAGTEDTPASEQMFRIVIDPGHGGADPGALQAGLSEKAITLAFARSLAAILGNTPGINVSLTRIDDRYVSLDDRVAYARGADADVFVSLHADAFESAEAAGATFYTLSDRASDAMSAALAEQHLLSDSAIAIAPPHVEDDLAATLISLAYANTKPASEALSREFAYAFEEAGLVLNKYPNRSAGFRVLKAQEIPSVLVELGFMSNPMDRQNLQNPEWRRRAVNALARAILEWEQMQ